MNYEKAYKEALERAKAFKSPYCLHAAEVIFPELKESEDEKIRKALIQGLSELRTCFPTCPTFGDVKVEDILAWLEKQGEKTPTWSEEDEDMFLMCSDAIAAACAAGYYTTEEMHTMQNWLKSIKPNHWKPSEGHLECLDYVIEKSKEDYSPLFSNRIYLTLKALKEQLQKL